MPDVNSLYPAPPQPQQGLLSGDPLRLIGALGEMQRIQLLGQQMPALAQQPAAVLANTQLANTTARLAQQADAQHRVAAGIGAALQGVTNPTADDVHSAATYFARSNPDIATNYPDMIPAASDLVLNHPKGVKFGSGVLLNSALSPGEASSRTGVVDQGSGVPVTIPVPQANLAGAQGLPTGLPAGAPESAATMQADLGRARNFGQEMFPWQQALSKMEDLQAKGQTFGPGTKGRQEVESFVQSLSPTVARLAGIDPEKVAGYAEVEKYLTQGLQARANNMGPHTNEGLATAASGTPNVHITDLAGIPLIKATIGMRRFEQAQTLENSQYGGPAYTQKSAEWAAKQDPRALMIDMMSPDQIKQLQGSLKGQERARFNSTLQTAIRHGLITPPGQ